MSEEHHASGEHEHQGPLVIFFVVLGLLLGGALRQVNKKTKFPYTPLLIVTGLFMGYFRHGLGVVGESTAIIEKLNPHMILFIFIPVLIFESAFNCDWFVFRKSIVNIIILAAPGVLWGAILLGSCFKLLLGYSDDELSWYQAFTLGSVLSATDPVAVVALLKQLGASVRFNTLIEGQSLLNDGTAMVFFMLFMQLAKGQSSSGAEVVANFIRIAIGGPLLGILVGFLASSWMKRVVRDDILTANITFVSCYMAFYIAEFTWVKVSGILAIVVLGLYMSAVGKTKIYPQSEHSLHVIWSYVQYACETLIFLLTGVIIGVQMIQKSTITASDWIRMLFFWILMQVMRFIMVATFYPILGYFGYGLSKKEFVVLVYGGLRGALGLSLALIIGVDDELPTRFRQLTVFYMSGMAILTILVNGLTCSKVVNYVQMIVSPPIKDRLLKSCLKKVEKTTRQKIAELKTNRFLMAAEWKEVEKLAGMTPTSRKMAMTPRTQDIQLRDSVFSGINKSEALEETRFRMLRYLKGLVWEQFETGEVGEEGATVLSETCDILLDQTSEKINFWEVLSKNFTQFRDIAFWIKVKDYPIIGSIAKSIILNRVYFVYDTSSSMVMMCQEAIQQFDEHFPLRKEYLNIVFEEIQENISLAESYICELESTYQMLIMSIHTQKAALNLLTTRKIALNEMLSEGFIDDGQYKEIRKELDKQFIEVQNGDFKWEAITYHEILLECPMFSELSREQLKELRLNSTERAFNPNTMILRKDQDMTHVYVVVSGIVKEAYPRFKLSRGVGNFLTPYSIISGEACMCNVRTESAVKVLAIKLSTFKELMGKNQGLQARVYKAAFASAIKHEATNRLGLQTEHKLRSLAEKSLVHRLQAGETMTLEHGGYMLRGKINDKRGQTVAVKGYGADSKNFIEEHTTVQAQIDSLLLIFKNNVLEKSSEKGRLSMLIQDDS